MKEGGGGGDPDSPVGTALLPALSNSSGGESDELHGKKGTWKPHTSYSRPFRIYDDGKIHIVPRLNERVDGVDVDFVPRKYLLRVNPGH